MTSRFQHVRTRKSAKKTKKTKKKAPKASLEDLMKAASSASESLDIEGAYQAYGQAADLLKQTKDLKTAEDLIFVLEKMGELQVSIGDQDLAKEHFVQSLELLEEGGKTQPTKSMNYYETHSSLCFYIGQLSLEEEALHAYKNGIGSLEKCMQLIEKGTTSMEDETMETDTDSNTQVQNMLIQKLSGAYCNLAELYLTDLCEEDTAESDCEQYLEKALQLKDTDGEPLVDALQTMASLRLSQQERQLEAVPFILRAYEKQRIGSEALATLVGLNSNKETTKEDGDDDVKAQELIEVEAASNLPEFEFRCQTAKLLLECAELLKESRSNAMEESSTSNKHDECISAAISVLGSLLAQNDEVIEIWYLTGCAFASKQPPLVDTSKFYLNRANEMLASIQKSLKEESLFVDDLERPELEEQLEMNAAQMSDVQLKLDSLPEGDDDMMKE